MARSKIGTISVDVEARLAKFESDVGRAARLLEREMSRSAAKSEQAINQMRKQIEKEMESVRRAAVGVRNAFIGLVSANLAGDFLRTLAKMNDGYINIQSQLMQTTRTQKELNKATRETFELSQRTFASFESTGLLVGRTARALQSAGRDQNTALEQSLEFSEAINNAFILSGAKAIEAKNAILQLSQGLSSGTLRGDEYRSVAEQGSKVTEILAKNLKEVDGNLQLANGSMGITTGRLRELAYEGKLTTDLVVGAMSAGFEELAAGVGKIPLTIERAFLQLTNAAENYIGSSTAIRNITAEVAKTISLLAMNFAAVADAAVNASIAIGAVVTARGLAAMVEFAKRAYESRAAIIAKDAAELAAAKTDELAAQATLRKAQAEVAYMTSVAASTQAIGASMLAERGRLAVQAAGIQSTIASLKLQEQTRSVKGKIIYQEAALNRVLAQQNVVMNSLNALQTKLISTNTAQAAATAELTAAQNALAASGARVAAGQAAAAASALTLSNVANKLGSGALALVGGTLGAVTLGLAAAAYGLYNVERAFNSGSEAILEYDQVLQKTVDSSADAAAARSLELANLKDSIMAKREELILAREQLSATDGVTGALKMNFLTASSTYTVSALLASEYTDQINLLSEQLRSATEQLKLYKNETERRAGEEQQAKDVKDFIENLQEQNEKLREQTIELASGGRALLLYQAAKAGVFNDPAATQTLEAELDLYDQLSAGVKKLTAEEQKRGRAKKDDDKAARQAALAERRANRDFEKQFKDQAKAAAALASAYKELDKLSLELSDTISEPMKAALEANAQDMEKLREIERELMLQHGDSAVALEVLADLYDKFNAKAQDRLDKAEEEQDVGGQLLKSLDDEISLLRVAEPLREEELMMRELLLAAEAANVKISPEKMAWLREEVRIRLEIIKTLQEQEATLAKVTGMFEQFGEGALDSLTTFFVEGKDGFEDFADSLKDTAKRMVSEMLSEFARLEILNPLLNNILGGNRQTGGFFDSLSGGGGLMEMLGMGVAGAGIGSGIGSMLFGGSRQNQLGGALGGAAGGLFAGTTFGATIIGSALSAMGVGAALGSVVPIVGTVIGAVLGAALGNLFEDDPRLRVGGGNTVRGRSTRRTFDTALGTTGFFDTEEQSNQFLDSLREAFIGFDAAIAAFLNPQQRQAAEDALESTNFRYDNREITPENILGERFDVILGTFEDYIQDFVGVTGDLEERVQRLADALFIEEAASDGTLLSDFTELAALLEDLKLPDEALNETFVRLAVSAELIEQAFGMAGVSVDWTREQLIRFSAETVQAMGGVEAALAGFQSYFENFYSEAEQQAYALNQLRATQSAAFTEIGLDPAQFAGRNGMQAFRQLFEGQMATLSGEALSQWIAAGNALAAVVMLQEQMNGVTEETIEILEVSLETIMSYVSEVRGLQDQLAEMTLSDFQQELRQIATDFTDTTVNLNEMARAMGLAGARTEDLATAHEVAAMRAARAAATLMASARSLVLSMQAEDLDVEIRRLEGLSEASTSTLQNFANAVSEVTESVRDNIDLLLGDLSPLKDREKLALAMQAQAQGRVGPEDVLRIAQRLFASGEDYNQIFRQVMAIGDRRQSGSDGGGGGGSSTSEETTRISPELAALYAQRDALEEQQRQAARFADANELAQMVADLAGFRDESFTEIADLLGLDLSTLVRDLGLENIDDLFEMLTNMQAQDYTLEDIAATVTAGDLLIVGAIRELIGATTPTYGDDVVIPIEAGELVIGGRGGKSYMEEQFDRQEAINMAVVETLREIANNTGASAVALDRLAATKQEQSDLMLMTTHRNQRAK